jgi:hypothetical protein
MAQEIWIELITTRQAFLQTLALFTPDNFNTIPFSDSWTPGQVAEHVFKSVDGVPQLLQTDGLPTGRDPALHVANLRAMFLDFETKMKSPPFILPSNEPKDIQPLSQALANQLAAIIEAAQTIDTSLTVANFEFPGSGPVTRLELLNFISVHTQRHTHQLKEIHKHF